MIPPSFAGSSDGRVLVSLPVNFVFKLLEYGSGGSDAVGVALSVPGPLLPTPTFVSLKSFIPCVSSKYGLRFPTCAAPREDEYVGSVESVCAYSGLSPPPPTGRASYMAALPIGFSPARCISTASSCYVWILW
ncbi:uncharacterized protein MICPUCDRAFT_38892 [Micromonas pusilla CCMP1545]|uniref:Predicted protein n=1 Tax=Micromonas pusilla (strain CCMP1545) TaxID=564608 RepID=C1MMH0_MICPC|nr:uncharacterized protein MICPUCDRAFT_38892 [Micromonas pusilla CCMP1545]EEH59050.1 predicted protein [Micromonas pusilla CCMP1545]|eukprot:XP_003057405.1 predicted protein [Micromonas pusilla CCMP1545]